METIYKGLPYSINISTIDGTPLDAIEVYLYNKSTKIKFVATVIDGGDNKKIATWSREQTMSMTVANYSLDVISSGNMLYHSENYASCVMSSQSI